MAFDADDEILQDFIIEAGEILETLSEQLVALESAPDDTDLLNGIFRGFHTVKGGAGFLQIDPLVNVCHAAENIFDLLRNGEIKLEQDLMDVILQSLDEIMHMFEKITVAEFPEEADSGLMTSLHKYTSSPASGASESDVAVAEPEVKAEPAKSNSEAPSFDEISDDEFDQLLDDIHGKGQFNTDVVSDQSKASNQNSDEMTDDEFDKLLDEIHGEGQFNPAGNEASSTDDSNQNDQGPKASALDEITDDEFDKLLDQIHGEGKGPTQVEEADVPMPKEVAALDESSAEKEAPVKESQPKVLKKEAKPAAKSEKTIATPSETTVRVDTKRLDDIMNMVGELVLARNRLVRLSFNDDNENLNKAVSNLDIVTSDLQMAVMKTRMQPVKKVFGRFPRVVRDLARTLNKEVKLELVGEDTDLDKNLVEALADPLVHLVRNSVDHGIEMPDVRKASGKEKQGTIVLSAAQEGDQILLQIKDDGAGIDADIIKQKAYEKGILDPDALDRMPNKEVYDLIFHPGFSTKTEVSDISGRGVGMDVVKSKITSLNGAVEIDSEKGEGTLISIRVPLTLAIMPTLMVRISSSSYALPLVNIEEIYNYDLADINMVDNQRMVVIRNKAIPIFFPKEWLFHEAPELQGMAEVVIINVGSKKIGLVVDQLLDQEEVVIKPLGRLLHNAPGMAGATITGDGCIALIIDMPGLLKAYA